MILTRRELMAGAAASTAFGTVNAQSRRTAIVPFEHSAFPYDGPIPDTGKPFLEVSKDGKRGHTSPRGGVYFVEPTYSDRNTLLHLGANVTNGTLVVFFHGNNAKLAGEVVARQRVPAQFDASGLSGALVAPQMAVNALDSSAGRFWEAGFFANYLAEAAQKLGQISGAGAGVFQRMPVVIVAYSGGYNPAAYVLQHGGAGSRIKGVVLLDALFGEIPRIAQWVSANHTRAFFVSAYGPSSAGEHARLRASLASAGVGVQDGAPQKLAGGGVWFIDSKGASHNDFVTRAWVANPLKDILSRMR